MTSIFLIALACLTLPTLLYFGLSGGRGPEWGLVRAGDEPVGEGAYRRAHVKRWKLGSAPMVVRVAAVSSFFLGQMILPGALAALVGFVMLFGAHHVEPLWLVLQISAPTGLAVAAMLLSTGWAMLARDPSAEAKARKAARWAIGHNLALLVGLGVAVTADPREPLLALPSCIYACFSIGQALVVRRAAAALAKYDAGQERDPAPVEPAVVAVAGAGAR